ncbi:MAG: hypothetical protein ACJ76F_13205, partial [Bacteroidia bacterium]
MNRCILNNYPCVLLFCVLLLTSSGLNAGTQVFSEPNRARDSLKDLLHQAKDNCRRSELNYLLGKEASDNENNEAALNYGKKALAIAKDANCKELLLKCYNLVGTAFDDLANYSEAEKYYTVGLETAKKENNFKYASVFYTNIGECFRNQDNFSKALDSYMHALKIDGEQKDSVRIVSDYFTLTLLYSNIEEPHSFKKYLLKTIDLAAKLNNEKVMAKCYNMYGIYQGNQEHYDSAQYFYYKGLELAKKNGILHLEAKIYSNLSDIFMNKKDMAKTIEY